MRIKILKKIVLKGRNIYAGSVLDIIKSKAESLIKNDFAEETNEPFKLILNEPKTKKANVSKVEKINKSSE